MRKPFKYNNYLKNLKNMSSVGNRCPFFITNLGSSLEKKLVLMVYKSLFEDCNSFHKYIGQLIVTDVSYLTQLYKLTWGLG